MLSSTLSKSIIKQVSKLSLPKTTQYRYFTGAFEPKVNHYDTLGLSPTATDKEITAAYRQLAIQLHPDVNDAANAEEAFVAVNEAYRVLKDPELRKKFDETIKTPITLSKSVKGVRGETEILDEDIRVRSGWGAWVPLFVIPSFLIYGAIAQSRGSSRDSDDKAYLHNPHQFVNAQPATASL